MTMRQNNEYKVALLPFYILETNLARFYFVLSIVADKFCGPKLPATTCWKIS